MAVETLPVTNGEREQKRGQALLKAIGLDRVPAEQREIALAIAKRYELDLLLKHLVLVDGRPYITRDGLLHVAHRSGQLDGIEVSDPELVKLDGVGEFWRAKASVYRKDMSRPFVYQGRYPAKGGNQRYAPEMAVKVAEVMALRRAFDVSAPVIEERWDVAPESVVTIEEPTITESIAAKRAAITSGQEEAPPLPPPAQPHQPARAGMREDPDPAGPSSEPPADPPGEPSEGSQERNPSTGAGKADTAPDTTPERCAGFDEGYGRCVRDAGHPGNHQTADRESWK